MKKLLCLTRLFLCLFAGLSSTSAFAAATWIGNSYININGTWYKGSGSGDWASRGVFNNKDLGHVSSLTIGGQIQIYDPDGTGWSSGAKWMHYTIDKNDGAWVDLNISKSGTSDNNMVFQTGGENFNTITIDISGLSFGEHTLSVYFGEIDGNNDNNGGNNYVATFTKVIDISEATVTGVDASYDWTGSVIHPNPVVTVGDTQLTSSDYDVTYNGGCTNAGDYSITLTGKGNYTGTKDVNFSILVPTGYYLVGTMNSWELNTNYKLAQNTVNQNEYYINNVTLSASDEIKVVRTDDRKTKNEYFPGGVTPNYKPGDGKFFIYFRPDGGGGDDWYYHYIYATMTASVDVALAGTGYGTYYNSTCEVTLPTGVVAYVMNNATPTYEKIADGDGTNVLKTVPAGVAVLLYSASKPEKVTLNLSTETSDSRTFTNLLHGSDTETTTSGGNYYYKLTYSKTNDNFGWYWGEEDGLAFTSPAHKAWLALQALPSGTARAFFSLPGDDFTGIATIEKRQQDADNVWYDLNGRRINAPTTKGIYVKDGRKLVIK